MAMITPTTMSSMTMLPMARTESTVSLKEGIGNVGSAGDHAYFTPWRDDDQSISMTKTIRQCVDIKGELYWPPKRIELRYEDGRPAANSGARRQ